MSFWSDFLETVKGVGQTVGGAVASLPKGLVGSFVESGRQIGVAQATKADPVAAAIAGINTATATKQSLEKAGIEVSDRGSVKMIDPVLKVAAAADEYVFSPLIKRPFGAASLLADPNSPLYEREEFGKGFQLSDVREAYRRTQEVPLGVALTKSLPFALTPIGQLERWALTDLGGIDLDEVDLWNNDDIRKNFTDNPVGRFISGTNDFVVGEALINAAFLGAGPAIKGLTKAAGLNTRLKVSDYNDINDLVNKVDEHLRFRRSEGAEGAYYNIGEDVERMAASTEPMDVLPIARKYTRNPEALDYITKTTEPEKVLDYILMDIGDFGAYQRMVTRGDADEAWSISNAGNEIRSDYLLNGKVRDFTPEQRARWMQAHDDAIRKDPEQLRLFNSFFDAEYDDAGKMVTANPKFLSKEYKPAEPVIGRELLGTIRSKASKAKSMTIQRDFTNAPGIAKTILSSGVGRPVTALMRIVGTYMPNGFVSHSTLRPTQGIQELIATFDDVPLFTRGESVITLRNGQKTTVTDYRNNILKEYMGLRSDSEKANFLDKLNDDMVYTIAYSRGFFDNEVIDSFIKSVKDDINSVHSQLTETGYAMTPNSVRVSTDEKTQRMLRNSTPMLPFGSLDSLLQRAVRAEKAPLAGGLVNVVELAGSAARTIFELGNKAFSFAQLYRFSYIPKNSIFEPMLAAWFAQGAQVVAQATNSLAGRTVNAFTNSLGRNYAKVKSVLPGNAIGEVNRELKALNKDLSLAVALRDQRYAEYHKYFVDENGVSPKTKGEYADQIREELRNSERIIADIESKLNTYTVEVYSKNIKNLLNIPSIYTLRARIDTLKKADPGRYASEIRTAEIALGKAVGEMNTLAPDLIKIDKTIAAAYNDIGKIMDEIKPRLKEEAELFSISENKYLRQPKTPDMQKFQTRDGDTIEFPAFSDKRFFGDAYVSEIANTSDRTIEILGNKLSVGRVRSMFRNNASKVTKPTDPEYFAELEFIVNNRMRGDEIVDKILAGADRATLVAWSKTTPGKAYAVSRGKDPENFVDTIDDTIRYVNSLLPTMEAKALALKGPVNQFELQKALADKVDQMAGIQPLDVEYDKPSVMAGLMNGIDAGIARAWRQLLKAENIVREVYANKAHARIVIDKAKALEAQGQKVTYDTLMALRRGAAADIVEDLNKTFYAIPRQHRALYLARFLTVFPNAAFSGFYRYTGFAVRQPRRTAGFLNAYYSLYNTYGVDKYGNQVENPEDAEYLLIPGTRELGFNEGKGIIVNARATNFLANLPGPNYLIPVPISVVLADKPDADKTIKSIIDNSIGRLPGFSYEELFPFGIQATKDQIKTTFTPSWARDLYAAFKANEDNLMWRNVIENEAQYLNAMADMGLRKPPTYKEIVDNAKNSYYRRAFNKFFSVLGSPQVLGQYGIGMFEDYYQMLIEINKAKGMNDIQAVEEAEKQFQTQVRVSEDLPFSMDRLFVDVRKRSAYFPPSIEAFERIYEDFAGVAKVLENKAPETVGLLAADLPYEYNGQVARFLNDPNATLPGGTKLNSQINSRQQVEKELELSRFWGAYTTKIKSLNEVARKAKYASYRSVPELIAEKDKFVAELSEASPIWGYEFKLNASSGDKAFMWADAIKTIVKDKSDGSKNRFMKKFGDSQFWVHAKAFSDARDQYVKAYEDAPKGYKSQVQRLWLNKIDETLDLWDPTMQKIITRYFLNDSLEATE